MKNRIMFFSALLLSAFGYEFIFFIMTLHIYDLSKSALNIGIFTTLTFIPRLFSSLMGGIADQLGKGRCLAFSSAIVGILLFLMSNTIEIFRIYFIWFIASVFLTFIVNARSALMAEIVAMEHFTSGNALALALLNGAKLFGPLIGGLIIRIYHIKLLLYFTGSIYFIVAALSFLIGIHAGRSTPDERTGFIENAKKGMQFMMENDSFRLLGSVAFLWRLFLGLQISLFVIYIKSCLSGSDQQYGIFMTVIGIGSIAGSLLGSCVSRRISPSRLINIGLSLHVILLLNRKTLLQINTPIKSVGL